MRALLRRTGRIRCPPLWAAGNCRPLLLRIHVSLSAILHGSLLGSGKLKELELLWWTSLKNRSTVEAPWPASCHQFRTHLGFGLLAQSASAINHSAPVWPPYYHGFRRPDCWSRWWWSQGFESRPRPALSSSARCPAIPNGEPFIAIDVPKGSAASDDSPAHARDILIRLRSFKGLRRLTRLLRALTARVRSARLASTLACAAVVWARALEWEDSDRPGGVSRIVSLGVTSAGSGSRPVEVAATPIWLMNCCLSCHRGFRGTSDEPGTHRASVRRTNGERREARKRDDRRSLAIGWPPGDEVKERRRSAWF